MRQIFIILGTVAGALTTLNAQHIDVDGKARFYYESADNADSVIVKLPDGSLGVVSRAAISRNIPDPEDLQDAATKAYVDGLITEVLNSLSKSNETFNSPTSGTVTDHQGNEYQIIKISAQSGSETVSSSASRSVNSLAQGSQWWMAENLRVTEYNDGTPIQEILVGEEWDMLTTPAYCWYNDDSLNYAYPYGAYYNFYTVADTNSKNICPIGWHVPSPSEWNMLIDLLDPDRIVDGFTLSHTAGGKLKETGETHWSSPNLATNESGFNAVASGVRHNDGPIAAFGQNARWWTSHSITDAYADPRFVVNWDTWIARGAWSKFLGHSVRCIRD